MRAARRMSVIMLVIASSGAAGFSGDSPKKSGDKSDPPSFKEESQLRGVNHITPFHLGSTWAFGRGAGFADLSGNGSQDLVLIAQSNWTVRLFLNDGNGFFTDASAASGLGQVVNASGVSFADYDGDGHIDIYITVWTQPDRLFRNNGDGTFTDVTAQAGLGCTGAGAGSAWADVNGDGWLDLFVANRTGTFRVDQSGLAEEPSRLYINQGDGTFTEEAEARGCLNADLAFQPGFFDANRDGAIDLYLAVDKGVGDCGTPLGKDMFFLNDGNGYFTEVSDEWGLTNCLDAMCVTVGDIDGDGWLDLYVTNTQTGNALYRNTGGGAFVDIAPQIGAALNHVGWGSLLFDCDNDGVTDLFVCNELGINRLLKYNGDQPMIDISAEMGVDDPDRAYGAAMADVNGNGAMDFVVTSWGNKRTKLYINNATEGRSWLTVEALGPWPNTYAVGAIIEIMVDGQWRARQVMAGSSYKSQNQLAQHFGLGSIEIVDAVRVTWPDGHQRVVTNVPARQAITLRHCPADINNDGMLTFQDFFDFANAFMAGSLRDADLNSASATSPLAPGFGAPDGRITPADFVAFVFAYISGCPE